MSRLSASQVLIFVGVFSAASVIGNIILIQDNWSKDSKLTHQSELLDNQQIELEKQGSQKIAQVQRLDSMGSQQEELASYIGTLQTQLLDITKEYKRNVETANLTLQRLDSVSSHAERLDQKLDQQKTFLAENEKTISNQQRLIRSLQSHSGSPNTSVTTQWQDDLSSLTNTLTPNFPEISISVSGTGGGIIDIPQKSIFGGDGMTLNLASKDILKSISNTIIDYPQATIDIIGHADARPIVTPSLLEKYPTNWELSSARASKIAQAMVQLGVRSDLLTASGKASGKPIRDGANNEAWQINRRIEIRIQP